MHFDHLNFNINTKFSARRQTAAAENIFICIYIIKNKSNENTLDWSESFGGNYDAKLNKLCSFHSMWSWTTNWIFNREESFLVAFPISSWGQQQKVVFSSSTCRKPCRICVCVCMHECSSFFFTYVRYRTVSGLVFHQCQIERINFDVDAQFILSQKIWFYRISSVWLSIGIYQST